MTCRAAGCDRPLHRRNKTGLCAAHVKSDPAYRARLAQSQRRALALDPTILERRAAAMRAKASTPEWKARNAELCRDRRLWEKGVAALTPEIRAQQGRTFSARHGVASWSPPELVDLARALRAHGATLEEAKRMVDEQHERDMQRFRERIGAGK